jgi:hypothetical protein
MSSAALSADQLRFINLVAARRIGGDAHASPAAPHVEFDGAQSAPAARRVAELGAALAHPGVVAETALPTVLLAVICQLHREGYRLVAPQGVAAGMIRGLNTGDVSVESFAAWLEDRTIAG